MWMLLRNCVAENRCLRLEVDALREVVLAPKSDVNTRAAALKALEHIGRPSPSVTGSQKMSRSVRSNKPPRKTTAACLRVRHPKCPRKR